MAKKFGKLVLFGVVAGTAAASAYYYIQKKKSAEDDFEDLGNFDENDPVVSVTPGRQYISLDSAKAFVTDTFEKAKDTITKVGKKFTNADEDPAEVYDIIEEDESAEMAPAAGQAGGDSAAEDADGSAGSAPAAEDAAAGSNAFSGASSAGNSAGNTGEDSDEGSIEEFFDDEES